MFYLTLLSRVVTSNAIRGSLHHQPCRLTQGEVWFSSWPHPTASSDNGTRALKNGSSLIQPQRICRGSAARACCYLGEAQERLDSGHSPVALFCYCLLWYLQKKSDSLHRTLSRSRFVWLQKMAFKASISHSIQNFSPSGLCLYRTQLSEEISNTWNTSQDCLQSSYLACHVGLFRSCSCRNLYAQIT